MKGLPLSPLTLLLAAATSLSAMAADVRINQTEINLAANAVPIHTPKNPQAIAEIPAAVGYLV